MQKKSVTTPLPVEGKINWFADGLLVRFYADVTTPLPVEGKINGSWLLQRIALVESHDPSTGRRKNQLAGALYWLETPTVTTPLPVEGKINSWR